MKMRDLKHGKKFVIWTDIGEAVTSHTIDLYYFVGVEEEIGKPLKNGILDPSNGIVRIIGERELDLNVIQIDD